MKNASILFLTFILLFSCKETKTDNTVLNHEAEALEKTDEMEQVVQNILDYPALQSLFHAEIPERLPLKMVENEYTKPEWNLLKFNQKVRIASIATYEKEGIEDYLILALLEQKKDTIHFYLSYDAEGIKVDATLIKTFDEWAIEEYSFWEVEQKQATPKKVRASIKTLAYSGADLGYLGSRYYDNKAYRHVLSAYNNFTGSRSTDKKQDSIKIPELSFLSKDTSLPRLQTIDEALDKIIAARNLYLKIERSLWDLPIDPENRNSRQVSQAQKLKLLGASKLIFECIAGLEQQEKPPEKAIGQFRQVAENLENIASGKIDENGYVLDIVHQRLSYGLGNIIKWAKED